LLADLREGGDRVTANLKSVAELAGVSTGLVSRVLNQDPNVSLRESTRRRIVAAAKELNYVPQASARALRRNRSGVLGLALHDLSSTVSVGLLEGARSAAADQGYLLLLADADELATNAPTRSLYLAGGRVDGLMIQGGRRDLDERIAEIARGLPTVIVKAPGQNGIPGVRLAEEDAGALAASYLLQLGHRSIGYLGGVRTSFTDEARRDGVVQTLNDAGLVLRTVELESKGGTAHSGGLELKAIMTEHREVTAFVAANVVVAMGALRVAADLGISVPRDLSIISVQETWTADFMIPRLSAVALPMRRLGEVAVAQLLCLINEDSAPADVRITEPAPALICRESTGAPPQNSVSSSSAAFGA